MLDRHICFVDLETTGATARFDRITEVGIVEVDRGRVVGEWSTLVNPQVRIPPAIEALTGISNDMVAGAPPFEALAEDLLERLAGRLFVAHNARFDYGFLKAEFRRAGVRWQAPVVCTVKLSRRLFPEHRRHNLDSLIERHGIACDARHRALGDARVVWEFVRRVAERTEAATLDAAVEAQLRAPAHPAGLPEGALDDLPEAPGVYIFFGENRAPLYVGKSVNLRSRVWSHFTGDQRLGKDLRITQQITDIEWIETAGELGALLQEARLVKQLKPIHNRMLRRESDLCSYRFDPAADPRAAPELVYARDQDFGAPEHLYGLFRTRRDALKALRGMADQHRLCHILLGLENGRGPCFSHQLRKCRGACVGKEDPRTHAMRLLAAFHKLRLKAWPFRGRVGIREQDAEGGPVELHVFDRWCYLGTVREDWELFDDARLDAAPGFDPDAYRILMRWLERNPGRSGVVELAR